jgi:hypothetical protein
MADSVPPGKVQVRLSITPHQLTTVSADEIPTLRAEGFLDKDQSGGFLDPAVKAPAGKATTDTKGA